MTQTTITTYDKYMYFTWRGISSSKYNCFIVNDKHSLQFVNAPSFSNNYADAMYQNKSYFLGTSVQRKTLTFKVACDRITLGEYREFLSWLNIYSIGFLQLDYEDWYGYNVKLSALTESEKYPVYECNGEMVYMVVLTLTFETTDDFYAVHKYQTMAFIERYPFNYLASENLVENGDLLIDSNGDGVPDGFSYINATDISLTNGIAKYKGTSASADFYTSFPNNIGDKIYFFAYVKSVASNTSILVTSPTSSAFHSGSGNFEWLSVITEKTNYLSYIHIRDNRTSGWTPIEVGSIGAINITDLISRGILPSGLADSQYKIMIDNIFFPQSYQITDSIFNPESNEEIHLYDTTEDDRKVLYIALDNYGTLDTSFKLGISQMNGQFTFNYVIADNTLWSPGSLSSRTYDYLGYVETNNLDSIYTTNLEYDSNSGQCTSSGILAARAQAQGQLIFKTIDMPGNIVIPAQKRLVLKIILTKESIYYPSFMVQFQKRTQVI